MPLSDWQFSYNGLTFGNGTRFEVVSVDGLGTPSAKVSVVQKTGDHGAYVFADFFKERYITIEGEVLDATESDIDTLRDTFALRTNDAALRFKFPGVPARKVNCRPTRMFYTIDPLHSIGYLRWAVEMVAADPAIYDADTDTKLFEG